MRSLLLLFSCFCCCSALYSQSCSDSSYKLRFAAPDSLFTTHHVATADGGALVLAEVFAYPLKKVLLFRLDKKSRLLWSRSFTDASGLLQPTRVLELRDGSIAVAGTAYPFPAGPEKVFLLRLEAAGTLHWQKSYALVHTNLNPLYLPALSEGVDGELLLTWMSGTINDGVGQNASSLTALRVSSSGTVAWSKTFHLADGGVVNPAGIFLHGGKVLFAGQVLDRRLACSGSDIGSRGAFFVLQLDYGTGALVQDRYYCYREVPSNHMHVEGIDTHFSAELLHDGRLALFGTFYCRTDTSYMYKLLLDEYLQPSLARLYAVPYTGVHSATRIQVLPSGETGIAVVNTMTQEGWRATIAADEAIRRQRRLPFSSAIAAIDYKYHHSFPYLSYRWAPAAGAAFTLTNNNNLGTKPAIEFSFLAGDGDTLACLGTDHSFVTARPYSVEETSWTWQSVVDHTVGAAPLTLTAAAYPLQSESMCGEVSTCNAVAVQGPATFCAGAAVYTAHRNDGCRRSVQWTVAPAAGNATLEPVNDSTVRLHAAAGPAGPVRLSLIATLAGCPLVRDTLEVAVMPALQPLPADTVLCAGATLALSPGSGFASYLWQDGSTAPVYTVSAAGVYWVQVPAAGGCRSSDTVTVRVVPLPTAFLHDTALCAGLPLTLRPSASFATYLWSDGTTGPSLQVERAGRYHLRVTDAYGCSGEAEASVEEKPCPRQVYFPTAFTPDGDGLNDVYRPTVLSPPVYYRFTAYNRWGQHVFSTRDPGEGWNGRLGTALQPTGVFSWVCTYQFAGAPRVQASGTFLLLGR